jgi:hypothetical protein
MREELKEGLVGRPIIHLPEDLINLAKEPAGRKFAVRRTPEISFDFGHIEIMFLERQPDLRREPMNKLCTQVNGMIQSWIEVREYPATDPFACFNDLDRKAGPREIDRSGKACDTGAENENVWFRHAESLDDAGRRFKSWFLEYAGPSLVANDPA